MGKRPFGQMSSGQMSFWANVFLDKLLLGKCPSEQMSLWANVFWADVFWANVVLGKCLWANVSGQMSYGQISGHRFKYPNYSWQPTKHGILDGHGHGFKKNVLHSAVVFFTFSGHSSNIECLIWTLICQS
jgi:hypothetical protein